MLDSIGWIVTRVIMEEADHGNDDLAARMRLAFFGGPTGARALFDSMARLPDLKVDRLFDVALLLHSKFQQACAMPLSVESSDEFLRLYLEVCVEEKRLDLEKQKLAFRMQRWSQRCELSRAREMRLRDGVPPARETGSQDGVSEAEPVTLGIAVVTDSAA